MDYLNYFKKIYSALTPKEKYWLLLMFILILFSGILLLIIFIKNSTIIIPSHGGIIKIGLVKQPININPITQISEVDKILNRILFSSLYDLAEKIEPLENNKYWKVRIKENIFWSDGKKITSDDVIFTIYKIKEAEQFKKFFIFYPFWENIEAERISELEIKFKLEERYNFFEEILKDFFIVPKHIFADIPVLNWYLSEYNLKPISNGPYKIENISIEPNGFISNMLLSVNKYYHLQKPYISKIKIIFYPNKDDLIKNFNNGQINLFISEEPKDLATIKIPHTTKNFPISGYYAIFINQNQNLALKEKVIRQALSLSINKKVLISKILGNYALEIESPFYQFNNQTKLNYYNLDLANKILEENNWKLNNQNIREKQFKKTNIKLDFELIIPKVDYLEKLANLIKNEWQKIGVKINILPIETQKLIDDNIKNRNYQLILFGNLVYPPKDLYPFWHSSFIFWPGSNLSFYNNTQADKILEKIRVENYSEEDFKKLINIIEEDVPAIFLYSPHLSLISNNKIYGIEEELISYPDQVFRKISNWYIKTKRVFK